MPCKMENDCKTIQTARTTETETRHTWKQTGDKKWERKLKRKKKTQRRNQLMESGAGKMQKSSSEKSTSTVQDIKRYLLYNVRRGRAATQ